MVVAEGAIDPRDSRHVALEQHLVQVPLVAPREVVLGLQRQPAEQLLVRHAVVALDLHPPQPQAPVGRGAGGEQQAGHSSVQADATGVAGHARGTRRPTELILGPIATDRGDSRKNPATTARTRGALGSEDARMSPADWQSGPGLAYIAASSGPPAGPRRRGGAGGPA
ncbi:MAG: hypothetical protein M0C28_11225 [Candidatus Moduliflexus flocculans]|nr:hypothetical protein [Candidatus Moduliflexus flocculans]